MTRGGTLLVRLWPWVLAFAVTAPLLRPGYVLAYDMVFVPDLALRRDFLGFGSALPRAVPSDAVVAVLDELVPGMLLQKLVLVAALGLAGAGARRLVPRDDLVAQLAATTLYVWNPFVAERLGIGHWPLLLTYAALPWLLDAVRRWPQEGPALARVTLWLAVGSLSAAGGLVAAVFALVCVVVPGDRHGAGPVRAVVRRAGLVLVAAAAVNAPWVVAGLSHGAGAVSDPAAVELFAARGEGGLPPWLTVLGLGGIWNAEVVPASRTQWPAAAALVLVLVVAACGVRTAWRARSITHVGPLAVAGGLGLLGALAGWAVPDLAQWLVVHVPGAGLFRDSTRLLALLAPLEACLFGCGASALVRRLGPAPVRAAPATLLVLAPVALLPDLAGGLAGRLAPVAFPAEYAEARAVLDQRRELHEDEAVVLLPFSSYRRPEWNGDRRVLDPLGRFMTPDYLASDVLVVSARRIEGEDGRARRVETLLQDASATAAEAGREEAIEGLRREGVRWVLLDKDAERALGPAAPVVRPDGEPVLHDGPRLTVWELGGPVRGGADDKLRRVLQTGAWAVAASALLAALVTLGARRRGRGGPTTGQA